MLVMASGYDTEKEYKQALQEKNHPNVYGSPAKHDYAKPVMTDRVQEQLVKKEKFKKLLDKQVMKE